MLEIFLSLISDGNIPSLIRDRNILFRDRIIPSLIAFFFKKSDKSWSYISDEKFKFRDGIIPSLLRDRWKKKSVAKN